MSDPVPTTEGQQLSTELIEAQKMRADLLKWKIVLIAALVVVGLGLVRRTDTGHAYADLVLCAIPLAMAYVDLLCRQVHLRIQVIGCYRLKAKGEYYDYERFAQKAGALKAFSLDSVALVGASVFVCFALVVLPLVVEPQIPHRTEVVVSGAVGIVLAVLVEAWWRHVRGGVASLDVA